MPALFFTGYKTTAADPTAKRAGVLYQLKAILPGPVGCSIVLNIIAARLARFNKTTTHQRLHHNRHMQVVRQSPAQ